MTETVSEERRPRTETGSGGQGSWVLGLRAKGTVGGLDSRQRGGEMVVTGEELVQSLVVVAGQFSLPF